MESNKMIRKCSFVEPLYLDKTSKNQEVYIPDVFAKDLTQVGRDALRYLYKHYKEKSKAVFLYGPRDSSNILEILFVQSLCDKDPLNRPILFIVNAERMNIWRDLFNNWTHNSLEDVLCDPKNIFAKKKIFLVTVDDLPNACRREWNIVVIDTLFGESVNLTRHYLYYLKTNLFVFNSTVDVKLSIEFYEKIYKCINQKCTFDSEEYIFSYREEGVLISPNKKAKNKDPTGMKVKSSKKRKIIDTDDNNSDISDVENRNDVNIKELINFNKSTDDFSSDASHNDIIHKTIENDVSLEKFEIDTSCIAKENSTDRFESEVSHNKNGTEINYEDKHVARDDKDEDTNHTISEVKTEMSNANIVENITKQDENTPTGNQSLHELILNQYF